MYALPRAPCLFRLFEKGATARARRCSGGDAGLLGLKFSWESGRTNSNRELEKQQLQVLPWTHTPGRRGERLLLPLLTLQEEQQAHG